MSPLPTKRRGTRGVIRQINTDDPVRLQRLAALGVVPGASIYVCQHWPAVVVEVGETTLALDSEVADCILVG